MSVEMIDESTYPIRKARDEAKRTVWAHLERIATGVFVIAFFVGAAGVAFLFVPDHLERTTVIIAWSALAVGFVIIQAARWLEWYGVGRAVLSVSLPALPIGAAGLVFLFVPDARELLALGGVWAAFVLGVVANGVGGVLAKRDFLKRIERLDGVDPMYALMFWQKRHPDLI